MMQVSKFPAKLPCKQCHKKYHVRTLIENLCPKCRAKRPFHVQQSELFYRHHAYKEQTLRLPRNLSALNKDELELALKALEAKKEELDVLHRHHQAWAYAARVAGKVDRHAHYADLLHELRYLLALAYQSRAHQKAAHAERLKTDPLDPTDRIEYEELWIETLRTVKRAIQYAWVTPGARVRIGNEKERVAHNGNWQAWLNAAQWQALQTEWENIIPGKGERMKSPAQWRSTPIPPRTGK